MNPPADLMRRLIAIDPIFAQARQIVTDAGQFNDIYIIDDTWVIRVPRTPAAAVTLRHEVQMLRALQGRLPLMVPDPVYVCETPGQEYMGYHLLPGVALLPEVLDAVPDVAGYDRIAAQIAAFLRALHALKPADLGLDLPLRDTPQEWADLYAQFQDKLYPFMRPDARAQVTRTFEHYLADARLHAWQPSMRHGDLGGSNILYDPESQRITGIIDFANTGYGDPALDVAALSTMGDDLLARIYQGYPAMATMMERARFYRSTYALQQALYALRDGNEDDFADGIAEYV